MKPCKFLPELGDKPFWTNVCTWLHPHVSIRLGVNKLHLWEGKPMPCARLKLALSGHVPQERYGESGTRNPGYLWQVLECKLNPNSLSCSQPKRNLFLNLLTVLCFTALWPHSLVLLWLHWLIYVIYKPKGWKTFCRETYLTQPCILRQTIHTKFLILGLPWFDQIL